MPTRIYGSSDDLIEVEGDYTGEVSCYGTDDRDEGVLLVFNDGTLLEVKYGNHGDAIWKVSAIKKGPLFDRIEQCDDEDAEIYSDIAYLKDGVKWCFAATKWERVN